MAENSVTIALKLDTSQFQSGLSSVKKQLEGLSGANLIGSAEPKSKSAGTSSAKQQVTAMSKSVNGLEKSIIYFTSMLRGNMSSFNVAGLGKSLMSAVNVGNVGTTAGTAGAGATATGAGAGTAEAGAAVAGAGATAGTAGAGATVAGAGGTAGAGATAAGAGATAGTGGLALLAVIPVLIAIGVGVAALIVIMEAIQFALKPILTMLSMIGKILGAALMPISLIIVELLKPLIWMMMPFVRVIMMMLLPVRKFIADRLKADKERIQGLSNTIATGNPLEKLQAGKLLEGIMLENAAQSMGFLFSPILNGIYDIMGGIVIEINKVIGNVVTGIISFLGSALIALGHTIVDIMPISDEQKESLKNNITAGISSAVEYANTTIKESVDTSNKNISDAVTLIKDQYMAIITNDSSAIASAADTFITNFREANQKIKDAMTEPFVNGVSDVNAEDTTNLSTASDTFIENVNSINSATEEVNEFLSNVQDSLQKVNTESEEYSEYLTVIATKKTDLQKRIDELSIAITKLVNNIISAVGAIIAKANELASQIINSARNVVSETISGVGSAIGIGSSKRVNDFILQPGGRLIETDPNDTIIGSKNGFGGGSEPVNISMNFNVYGNMDSAISDKIMDLVRKTIQTEMRSISR